MEQYVFELNLLSSTSPWLNSKNLVKRMYGTSVELKVATIFYRKERASFPSEPKVFMYCLTHDSKTSGNKQRNTLKQRFKLKDKRIIIYSYHVVDHHNSYNAGFNGKSKNMIFKY